MKENHSPKEWLTEKEASPMIHVIMVKNQVNMDRIIYLE
jgi:hypothetical protein